MYLKSTVNLGTIQEMIRHKGEVQPNHIFELVVRSEYVIIHDLML